MHAQCIPYLQTLDYSFPSSVPILLHQLLAFWGGREGGRKEGWRKNGRMDGRVKVCKMLVVVLQ